MDKQEQDSLLIEDSEQFNGSSAKGLKEIAIRQFERCQECCTKELVRGGVRKIVINGQMNEVIQPDSLSIFCNSVTALSITLEPKLKDMKKEMKTYIDIYLRQKQIFDNWNNKEIERLNYLARNDTPFSNTYEDDYANYNKVYDSKRLDLSFLLFKNLSILMSLCKYFDEGTIGG